MLGLIAFVQFSAKIQAQHFDIKIISTNEGLPSGQIGDVVQDKEGYIWLSTYDGLIQFDGKKSKAYTTRHGFRNDLIYDLFIDSENRFWVSVEDAGVGEFLGDTVIYHPSLSFLDSVMVIHMNESEDGRIWFSTYGSGVYIWDGENYVQLTEEDGLPSNYCWNIWFDDDGTAWIGNWKGVVKYTEEHIEVINQENGLSGQEAYTFTKDAEGTIWVSTSNGISLFDANKWSQINEAEGEPLGYVYDVLVDKNGLVWIATESKGLYWFDGDAFIHIDKSNGLSSNYLYSLHEDNHSQIWVATDENGVNLFRNKNFRIFSNSDKIFGESVNDIEEDGEYLWLATNLGLTRFSETSASIHFPLPDDFANYKEVWNIEKLPNGKFLLQTGNSVLLEFDGANFTDFGKKINLPWLAIQDFRVRDDIIWFGTESGLVKYQNGAYQYFKEEDGLADNFIWSLYQDQDGNIWAASDQGVSRVQGDSVKTYSFEDGIGGEEMYLINQSPNGSFWVGTNTGFSELVLDENEQVIKSRSFTLRDQFLTETQFLQFDDEGNLWQGTSGGLHFYHQSYLDTVSAGVIDGLFFPLQDYGKGLEMNFLAYHQDTEGNNWFGSYTHGLVKFEAGELPQKSPAPEPFISQIKINGQPVSDGRKLQNLSHSENNLTIHFGAFEFKDADRVYYCYRLKGFQDEWKTTYEIREASFTNLPPGPYEFEMQVKSIRSDWGSPLVLAAFQIQKPYWQNVWFYLLVLFLIILIIYGIVKTSLFYSEKKELDRLVAAKTSDLESALKEKDVLIKEIHHRVKNNMAVVSGLLDLQSYSMTDKKAKLALENSKLRIQAMSAIHEKLYQNKNLAEINFKNFAEDLVEKVSKSLKAENKNIEVSLEIDEGVINVNSAIPLGLIVNEALSNSYEHAFNGREEGTIKVVFTSLDDHNYSLIIQDNGVGMPENIMNNKLTTLGLSLIRSLVSQLKGEFEFIYEDGTTLNIRIPK